MRYPDCSQVRNQVDSVLCARIDLAYPPGAAPIPECGRSQRSRSGNGHSQPAGERDLEEPRAWGTGDRSLVAPVLGSPPKLSLSLTSHLFPGLPFTLGPPAGGRGCTEPSPGPSRLSVLRACRAERRIRGPQRWEQRDNGSIVICQPGPAGPNCSIHCPEQGEEG